MGALLATAANSRALYPILQLNLRANGGKTLGRALEGLTAASTEAQVDAYLQNPQFYPVGMFDDTFDGNGNPMHITPFFRQDLAAPFGSGGTIAKLENFNNLVYTGLLDLTDLTTPGGRAFLHKLGGAAGDEIADEYVKVLAATGVTGYPYVQGSAHPGSRHSIRGRTPRAIPFDDKMAVVNASLRGDVRGIALPLLLDLARKPVFLHDNSVPTLDQLLSASRGAQAPHPFYISNTSERRDVIAFLRSLDTDSRVSP